MGDSLRTYLKMQNLFVRDIDRSTSPSVVKAHLDKLCPVSKGKVVLPIAHDKANAHIGQAYLNFNNPEDAKRCLDKYRFSIVFKGNPAKLMYSAIDKDRVYGAFSLKFQIIVKNLSEEVDVQMLYDFFSSFGEIYQCKTDTDVYDQYYGQVTYMDEDSVEAAVQGANQTRWQSSVIVVEPHHKAHLAYEQTSAPAPPPDASSTLDFPSLGGSSSSANAAAAAQQAQQQRQAQAQAAAQQQQRQQAAQQAAQQQHQQEQQQSLFSGPVNFALQATSSGSGGGGGGSGGGLLPPSFSHPLTPSTAAQPDLSPFSSNDMPVAMPSYPSDAAGRPGGLLGGAGGSGTIGSSSAVLGMGMDDVRLNLAGLNITGPGSSGGGSSAAGGLGPGVAAAPGGPVGDAGGGAPLPPRLGTHHLLNLLDRRRAEAAATSGGTPTGRLSPAGDQQVVGNSRRLGHLGASAAVGTPTSAALRAAKPRGGVIKGLLETLDQVSEALCCPITHEVFVDPAVAADGITYERAAIVNWLTNHNTSPMTNMKLANLQLHPNNLIKTLVEELL